MQIQYYSDIHLEFRQTALEIAEKIIPIPNTKVCLLLGDIGNPRKPTYLEFLQNLSLKFEKVFIIAGNHEYYFNGKTITLDLIQKITSQLPNVSFLNNTYEDYNGIRWIGSTLWSHINNPTKTINDIISIPDFGIEDYNNFNQTAIESINRILDLPDTKKCVVLSHHLPLHQLTHPKYRPYIAYQQWFSNNLDELIVKYKEKIAGWFYGHTHCSSVQEHLGVKFYCNPLGYPLENGPTDEIINSIAVVE